MSARIISLERSSEQNCKFFVVSFFFSSQQFFLCLFSPFDENSIWISAAFIQQQPTVATTALRGKQLQFNLNNCKRNKEWDEEASERVGDTVEVSWIICMKFDLCLEIAKSFGSRRQKTKNRAQIEDTSRSLHKNSSLLLLIVKWCSLD